MYKALLSTIDLNGKDYTHWINTTNGVTTLEEGISSIYTVDADGVVFNRVGRLGTICAHDNHMLYFECLSGLRIECNTKDLIKAEDKLFRYLLKL